MLPYWFTALCMKSVGTAAMAMVKEVERQFREIPGLLDGTPGHGEPALATPAAKSHNAFLGAHFESPPQNVGSCLWWKNLGFMK